MRLEAPPSEIDEFDWRWKNWINNLYEYIEDNLVVNYGLEVARGNVTGVAGLNKFGRSTAVGNGAQTTIWDANTAYTFSTSADITHLWSTAGDTQDIVVQGLDNSYAEVEQTVTLTGTTAVALGTALRFVNRMYVDDTTSPAGDVRAGDSGKTFYRSQITIGNNQTGQAVYTVPIGKTFYMEQWYANFNKSSGGAGSVDLQLEAILEGKVFRARSFLGVLSTGSSHFAHEYPVPQTFPAKTSIYIDGLASSANLDVSAGFEGYLVSN